MTSHASPHCDPAVCEGEGKGDMQEIRKLDPGRRRGSSVPSLIGRWPQRC